MKCSRRSLKSFAIGMLSPSCIGKGSCMTSFDLTDRVALVTGGSKGIGYGAVRQMLKAGANVAFACRTHFDGVAVAEALNDEFEGKGKTPRVMALTCDLGKIETLRPMVEATLARWGRIDTLVCNAADTGVRGSVDATSLERFGMILQTNIVHNFELARIVASGMVERREGSIIFITSISGMTPMPSNVAYAAAKAGLASVARSLAAEYAPYGVRVNCVAPGLTRSRASEPVWRNESVATPYIRENIPLNRIGEAEEIGAACVFLASSAGAFVTGLSIPIDGGRMGLGLTTHDPRTPRSRS
jgi:NAD(P)-dependent dehydrogenase (short-subunit alcohol dehydrogenase family)